MQGRRQGGERRRVRRHGIIGAPGRGGDLRPATGRRTGGCRAFAGDGDSHGGFRAAFRWAAGRGDEEFDAVREGASDGCVERTGDGAGDGRCRAVGCDDAAVGGDPGGGGGFAGFVEEGVVDGVGGCGEGERDANTESSYD